jgi:glutaredoxin
MESKLLKYISKGKLFIFSKSSCPHCKEAKELLVNLSIKFESVEVDLSNEFSEEFTNYIYKNSGIKTYPKIYIGQKCIGGMSDLRKLFESLNLFDLLKNENIKYNIFPLTEEMKNEFSDFNTNRQNLAKNPKQVYFFFPNKEHILEYDNKNLQKSTRRIFEGGQEFICYEKTKLEEFDNEIIKFNKISKKKKISFPEYWENYNTMRFLQAAGYNIAKTIEFLIEHFEWRCLNLPPVINDKSMQILNTGFLYLHGRDHKFRPIIHIKPSIITKYQKFFDFEDWNLATIYLLEYTINNLFLPGQIENWDIICDLKDCSVTSLPNDFKKILGILQNNYRCRLFRMFIINVGSFFNMMWGMIKKIIDSNTEKKIKILKSGNFKEIFEIINPSQIEIKYNGTAENINSYFFPPIFPSDKYLLETEKEEDILLSEVEYEKKIKENSNLKKWNIFQSENQNEKEIKNIENNNNYISMDSNYKKKYSIKSIESKNLILKLNERNNSISGFGTKKNTLKSKFGESDINYFTSKIKII